MIESFIHHLIHQGMNPDLMQRLAGSLLHFVWQGASIAMVSAIILRLLSNRSAEWRYSVSVAALLVMLAAPIVTFMFYKQTGQVTLMILQFLSDTIQGYGPSAAQAAITTTWTQWIVLAWFTGVLICSLRLIAGWRRSASLTRIGTSSAPSRIQHTFQVIKARLAMTKPVRLLVSLRIDTPVAVGWLRPAILLPVTALTGLNEEQLRAVLSHELAHVRRHDFLVNLVQRGVESILFYHPAVWWISARIRTEREHCCDDLAVQISGDPSMYARALMELERVRSVDPDPAVAATGGVLTRRIHRLLGHRIVNSDLQSAIAAMTFVVVWVIVGGWQTDGKLIAESPASPAIPAQIVVNPEVTLPRAAGAVNAIAAIVTALPVEPVQSPPTAAVGNGTVEGTLRDDSGLPAADFVVVASAVRGDAEVSSTEILRGTTDNNGRYRVEGIPAGRYRISAGRPEFTTYYPGTLEADRSNIVTVAPGTTTTNISFALDPLTEQFTNPVLVSPIRRTLANPAEFANAVKTGVGTLTLFVSVRIEGGGRIPIFVNGRSPKLRLTKLDTNVRYEMPFANVAIRVPVNLTYEITPDEYRASVEDLPAGYAVKSIMYRADEPGMRFVDVSTQTLRISSRAIYARHAGTTEVVGEPDLPIAITLTRTTAPTPPGIRVAGTGEGIFVMPQIPILGDEFSPVSDPRHIGVYISGRPGILYDNGTFEFAGVSPGSHAVILILDTGRTGPTIAAAEVVVRDRNVEGVSLQAVPVLPKDFASPKTVPVTAADASVLPLSSLTVRALDEATQQPVTSAYVTVSGVGVPVRNYVGISGLRIHNLLPGQYLLTAESYGYTTKTQAITVGFERTSFDITINRASK